MNQNVWLALGAIFCLWATQTVAFVLIPFAAVGLNLPGVAIGVLVGVLGGLGLVTDIPVAVISDHLGRRAPMVLGSALGLVAGWTLTVATDFLGLFVSAVSLGLSMSLLMGSVLAYLSEACSSRDAHRVQGYNGAFQGLGALAAAVAVGVAVDRFGAQPSAWLIVGLMAIAFLVFLCLDETVSGAKWPSNKEVIGSYAAAIRLLIARPQLQLAALVSLISQSVLFVVGNSFLPLYVVHDLGGSGLLVGTLLAVRNVATIFSSLVFFKFAVGRFGLIPTIFGANFSAVAGILVLSVVADSRLLAIPLLMQGLGMGLVPPTSNTLMISATRRQERALGFATNRFVSRIGGLVSPLLFGIILEASGGRAVFLAAGVIGVGYLVAMVTRVRRVGAEQRRRWASETPAEDARVSQPTIR